MEKIFLSLIILAMISMPFSLACQNTADNYALEVVLNKSDISYDLSAVSSIKNTISSDSMKILQSQSNKNLALVLSETADICLKCLSVRLQIPVETKTTKVPYIEFTSTIPAKKIALSTGITYYKGWSINHDSSTIELKKNSITITANPIGSNYEVLFSIQEALETCTNCDGKCLSSSYENACINKDMKADITDILKHIGLTDNFDSLFFSYKLLGLGEKTITDLTSAINPGSIDWQAAMTQNLNWLSSQKIIFISSDDIIKISNLASLGKAGINQRIIFNDNSWKYYYESSSAISQDISCREFPASLIPKDLPAPITGLSISTFYLVPLLSTGFLVVLLIVLIIVARTVCWSGGKNCDMPKK